MKASNYPVGDFLIRIKNAAMAGKKDVVVQKTKFIEQIAQTLREEGYLEDVKSDDENLTVKLVFHKKKPLLFNIELVSKPGLRIYKRVDEIEAMKGPFILILSTPKGVMSSRKALDNRTGGELIAKVW